MLKIANSIFATLKKERYGLYIHIKTNNVYDFYVIKSVLKRGEITILEKHHTDKYDDISNFIPAKSDVSVYISGKDILIKSFNDDISDSKVAFKKLFNNIDDSSFYYQSNLINETKWIAISRKTVIDSILNILPKDIFINGINILPPVENKIVASNNNNIIFGSHNNEYTPYLSKIISTQSDCNYSINHTEVNNNYLPAYYSLIATLHNAEDNKLSNYAYKESEFFYFKIASYIQIAAIAIFLLSLLVNFYIYTSYYSKVSAQQYTLSKNNQFINKINELESNLSKKQRIIKSVNINNSLSFSRIINSIAKRVPSSINLVDITIIPIRFRSDKVIKSNNEIRIKGETSTGLGVTKYIESLRKNKWIKEIKLVYLRNNVEENTSSFLLKALIKEGGYCE